MNEEFDSEDQLSDATSSMSKMVIIDSYNNFQMSTSLETVAAVATTPAKANDVEDAPGVTFYPSVCLQRYNRVRETLLSHLNETLDTSPVTLMEFGCAELRLHLHLKTMSERVQKLIYIDKDEITLDAVKQRIRPLAYEHLRKRETPLRVEVYSGCATKCDPRILMSEPPLFGVIGIEIIEHLDPDILSGFERTVFGLLNPPLVVLTTPNADFNVVFNMPPGKFRHWDHRFEWTRTEFKQWCDGICLQYPGYIYEISGIGAGTPDTIPLGCVSQMAVFRKTECIPIPVDYLKYHDIIIPECYRILAYEDYPFFVDPTPRDEQIVIGFKCHISNYVLNFSNLQDYRIDEKTEITLPIDVARYITGMPKEIQDLEEVRVALVKGGFHLKENPDTKVWEIILQVPPEDDDITNLYGDEEEMENDYNVSADPRNSPEATVPDCFNPNWDEEEW